MGIKIEGVEIDADIQDQFTYNSQPSDQMQKQFAEVSRAAMYYAQVVRNNTPQSADQTLALQHIVDARMRANKAISHQGRGFNRPPIRQQ